MTPEEKAKLQKEASARPVVSLVNQIFLDLIKKSASEIHFVPFENRFEVQHKIHNDMSIFMCPPQRVKDAIIARLKILAMIDIERQEVRGQLLFEISPQRVVPYLLTTEMTPHGEKAVLKAQYDIL